MPVAMRSKKSPDPGRRHMPSIVTVPGDVETRAGRGG